MSLCPVRLGTAFHVAEVGQSVNWVETTFPSIDNRFHSQWSWLPIWFFLWHITGSEVKLDTLDTGISLDRIWLQMKCFFIYLFKFCSHSVKVRYKTFVIECDTFITKNGHCNLNATWQQLKTKPIYTKFRSLEHRATETSIQINCMQCNRWQKNVLKVS